MAKFITIRIIGGAAIGIEAVNHTYGNKAADETILSFAQILWNSRTQDLDRTSWFDVGSDRTSN
ncbi:MAG TPA: hypothetical protein V6C91_07500 [Coleofasciculaceae cyanobacterium]